MNTKFGRPGSSRASALWATWALLGLLAIGWVYLSSSAGEHPAAWQPWALAAVLLAMGATAARLCQVINRLPARQAVKDPMPDAASEADQTNALAWLATLPQFRRLPDGSVIDMLHGAQVRLCRCGRHSTLHLWVDYGNRRGLGLVTRGTLTKYLAVQEAVGAGLRRQ
jgi:hypothetical protein